MGTVVFSGSGEQAYGATSIRVASGGTMVLDNSGSNVNSRIGGRGVYVDGNWTIIGNASAPTTEFNSVAGSNFNFENSGSVITLLPNAAQSLTLSTSNAFTYANGSTSLFRGNLLGSASGANVATFALVGTLTNPNYIGQASLTGTNEGILPWALADSSGTGNGTGFATFSTNGAQPLNFAGNAMGVTNVLTANANVLSSGTGITTVANSGVYTINSLTLNGGNLTLNPDSFVTLQSGGLLAVGSETVSGGGA